MVSTTSRAPTRDKTLNLRTTQEKVDVIDRAAKAQGRSRSEFIMDAAWREAADFLCDQTMIYLDDEAYDRFVEMLDNPPPPTEGLRRLLATKPPWE